MPVAQETESPVHHEDVPIRKGFRLEFGAEALQFLTRVRPGTGSTQLRSQTFGLQHAAPRQIALKLYF